VFGTEATVHSNILGWILPEIKQRGKKLGVWEGAQRMWPADMADKSGSGWPVGHIGIPVIGPNSPNDKL
jgi:hypothetical protein